jgi:hypothetical protein
MFRGRGVYQEAVWLLYLKWNYLAGPLSPASPMNGCLIVSVSWPPFWTRSLGASKRARAPRSNWRRQSRPLALM